MLCSTMVVYRELTHTNLYLNAESHHYSVNKHSILSTLVHKAKAVCNQESLQENWNSSVVHPNRMATVRGRSIVLLVHLVEKIHLERV